MFARIAQRYDLLNTLMTAGCHYGWRRRAVGMAIEGLTGRALDVATGTGDFALALAHEPSVIHVVGLDFTPEMLHIAARKARRNGVEDRVGYLLGNAHDLPFADGHFAYATVGFGIRNFTDVPQVLRELKRVVRPRGRVVLLEIVRKEGLGPVNWLFHVYFRYVIPWLGAIFAGDREAYTYLPESVQGFLTAGELSRVMGEAGFHNVTFRKLALGTVAIHVGEK